jgi:hypothetical protein
MDHTYKPWPVCLVYVLSLGLCHVASDFETILQKNVMSVSSSDPI